MKIEDADPDMLVYFAVTPIDVGSRTHSVPIPGENKVDFDDDAQVADYLEGIKLGMPSCLRCFTDWNAAMDDAKKLDPVSGKAYIAKGTIQRLSEMGYTWFYVNESQYLHFKG